VIIDTGPLVAFFDGSDRYHRICMDILKDLKGPLLTVWPVITETFYLLDFSWKAQDNFWEFMTRGGIEIVDQQGKSLERCRLLMRKYKDLPMDLADAALVVLAETRKEDTIFTLDHRDFSIYKPHHAKMFQLLPSQL
jgi:uncharacterized protein